MIILDFRLSSLRYAGNIANSMRQYCDSSSTVSKYCHIVMSWIFPCTILLARQIQYSIINSSAHQSWYAHFWHIRYHASPIVTSEGFQKAQTVATHTDLNPTLWHLHVWTQLHCLELIVNICKVPMVNYTGEHPAFSFSLIFQLGYLGVLKNNLAFMGFSTQRAKLFNERWKTKIDFPAIKQGCISLSGQ